jgi:hypothetical protein
MVVAGWWSIRCAAVPERTIAGIVEGPPRPWVWPELFEPRCPASLRFIAHLEHRLERLPVLIAATPRGRRAAHRLRKTVEVPPHQHFPANMASHRKLASVKRSGCTPGPHLEGAMRIFGRDSGSVHDAARPARADNGRVTSHTCAHRHRRAPRRRPGHRACQGRLGLIEALDRLVSDLSSAEGPVPGSAAAMGSASRQAGTGPGGGQ